MAKAFLKAGQVVFRRIRGRLVPVKISAETARRHALRAKASARTSLHIQRQKAIRAVFLTQKGKTRFLGKGLEARTFSAGKNAVKVPRRRNDDMFVRGVIKTFLGKKLAPRTFVVETSKRSFLVQERVARTDLEIRRAFNWKKPGRAEALKRKVGELRANVRAKGITPYDLDTTNSGILRGKVVATDSGEFKGKIVKIARNNPGKFNKFIVSVNKRSNKKHKIPSGFGGLVRSEERIKKNRLEMVQILKDFKDMGFKFK